MTPPDQPDLFTDPSADDAPALPPGMRYRPAFVDEREERALVEAIGRLPLAGAKYKAYTARRRIASFGSSYDFDANVAREAPPLPEDFAWLRDRAAAWIGVAPERIVDALVAEYRPGTPLGWHRDVPQFETVIGVSLAGAGRMRFRPYPHVVGRRAPVLDVDLPPRSGYVLAGEARWKWQHAVPPVRELRYSITFRTRRA